MLRPVAALVLLCGCSQAPSVPYVRRHVDGVQTAPCVQWPGREFTYELDPALSARTPGDTERAAVTRAFATWQAVADGCSDFRFIDGQGASRNNLIIWRERSCAQAAPANDPCFLDGTCPDRYACWDDGPESLAVTTLTYSRSTGNLLAAGIQLNGADWLFTTVDSPACREGAEASDCVATDVQNTLTHEIGHVIGLDHVIGRASTMSSASPLAETSKRVIDEGTAQGFCAIYPRSGAASGCTP